MAKSLCTSEFVKFSSESEKMWKKTFQQKHLANVALNDECCNGAIKQSVVRPSVIIWNVTFNTCRYWDNTLGRDNS